MEISLKNTLFNFIAKNKVHFIVWSIFIFYETILIGLIHGSYGTLGNYTIHYIYNISAFYCHAHFILPLVMKNPKHVFWKLPVDFVVSIILYTIIVVAIDYLLLKYTTIITFELNRDFFLRIGYRGFFFIGFSIGYYYLITFIKERERNIELEKQRLIGIIEQKEMQNELNVTVNAYLKAQINPHFLFNTLNFIYNNARKTAPEAADAIMTLSEMMRFAIRSEDAGEFIQLSSEIEQIENLIHLHQLRQNKSLQIDFMHSNIPENIKFIPLVLMTLTENIFKHGNLSRPAKPAVLNICVRDQKLHIHTKNLINENKNNSGEGIGLENVRKRLLHVYGDQVVFDYFVDEENFFQLSIILDLP